MKKQRLVVEYMGETIWRNTTRPHALRWSCLGYGAADTLQGMKSLIREAKLEARAIEAMRPDMYSVAAQ